MNAFQNNIIRNLEVMKGKPVIYNSRITVQLILKKLSEGVSTAEFIKMYPHIKQEEIFAALEYASNIIANEELLEVS